ncbi:MAG: PorT family protein [Ignavibacteria bacterium]|mgnify:CR=1 FL=1|nr:PorT family protein [Ignavibacteria bacterium]
MKRSKTILTGFKTGLLAAVIFLCAASTTYSQLSVKLGPEFGLNIANTSNTPSATTNSRIGLIIGGVVDVSISPQFSMVTGLRYIMKGNETVTADFFGSSTTTQKANFLEIPALAKVKFPLTEIKPYVIAGPTLGLKLSATTRTDQGTTGGQDVDNPNVETIDFGLFFGAGLDFNVVPTTDLFFQAGYSLGLSNLSKTANTTVKTTGIQLVVGAKFKI